MCVGGESTLSASLLTDSQRVKLSSVDFLCYWCQQTNESHEQADCCVLDKLVKLVDCDNQEMWSSAKLFHVHLVSEQGTTCLQLATYFVIK